MRRGGAVLLGILLACLGVGFAILNDGPKAEPPPPQQRGSSSTTTSPSTHTSVTSSSAHTSNTPYASRIMQDRPIAFWPLNDPGTGAVAETTGRYPGTSAGATVEGRPLVRSLGRSTHFNGINNRVTANSLTSVGSWPGYTLELWVRLTQESTEEHLIAFNTTDGENGPGLLHDQPTKKFKFRDCEGPTCAQAFSSATPELGVPYLVDLCVDEQNKGTLYVNGIPQAHFTSTHRPTHDGLFTIGAEYDSGPEVESYFHGDIAGVAVYDYGLSPAAVRAHYEAGR
jgi:hypothetical protein